MRIIFVEFFVDTIMKWEWDASYENDGSIPTIWEWQRPPKNENTNQTNQSLNLKVGTIKNYEMRMIFVFRLMRYRLWFIWEWDLG